MFRRIFLVFLLVLGISFAATAVTECMTINTPGYYVMTGDIHNNTDPECIEIASSNVIFDCNYSILNASAPGAWAFTIAVPPFIDNVTVANCTIHSANAIWTKTLHNNIYRNLEHYCYGGSGFSVSGENISMYNISSNCTKSLLYALFVANFTAENITGTNAFSTKIQLDMADHYLLKDVYNAEIYLDGSSNGTVENLYSSNPNSGYGYSIAEFSGISRNNTLKNAYISGCDTGFPTTCIDFSKSVIDVHLEDVELVMPAGLYLPSASSATGLTMRDAFAGLGFATENTTVEDFTIYNNATGWLGGPGLVLAGENITVNNARITVPAPETAMQVETTLTNSQVSNVVTNGGGRGIMVEGGAPYTNRNNFFSNIRIENVTATGVVLNDGAKFFNISNLIIVNAPKVGINIRNAGFSFPCNPGSPAFQRTSGNIFDGITITGVWAGIYTWPGSCGNEFYDVSIDADFAGILINGSTSNNTVDGIEITVANATDGLGLYVFHDRYSNYSDGEISGGAYCVYAENAFENNSYENLELHDCNTGFLMKNAIVVPFANKARNQDMDIHDVELEYDIGDYWQPRVPVVFEGVYFGDISGGIGLEFYTFGCVLLNTTPQPAPLPAGYTPFHTNYLEVTEITTTRTCNGAPGREGIMNQTSFLWTAAQEAGYDMGTLKVLRWNGRNWIELPSRLNLTDRSIEVGDLDHFSIFTLTADVAEGGNGNGGTKDKGDITLTVPAEAYVLDPVLIQAFDDHGDPLNAKVTVKLGDQTIFYGFVGMDGEVEVTPLLQGNYTVTAAKNNYDSPPAAYFMALLRDLEAVAPESVGENEQFEILVTSEGVLLEGARAEIDNLVRVTGADGTTTFTLSSAGNYGVEVTKAGYETWSGTVNVWAEGEEPEEEEGAEEEGIIIVDGEAEEETPSPPIVQGEVPSVDSLHRPLTEDQMRIQEHWLWMVLLLLLVVAAIAYWFSRKHKK